MTTTTTMTSAPVVTLSNGVRVANFSSPHSFRFTDGSLLPACEPERVARLSMDASEFELPGLCGTTDIDISFEISAAVASQLVAAQNDGDIDIVIVPRIVLEALKETNRQFLCRKARTIRMADRQSKIAHHDRFCR